MVIIHITPFKFGILTALLTIATHEPPSTGLTAEGRTVIGLARNTRVSPYKPRKPEILNS